MLLNRVLFDFGQNMENRVSSTHGTYEIPMVQEKWFPSLAPPWCTCVIRGKSGHNVTQDSLSSKCPTSTLPTLSHLGLPDIGIVLSSIRRCIDGSRKYGLCYRVPCWNNCPINIVRSFVQSGRAAIVAPTNERQTRLHALLTSGNLLSGD
jgi:hypothetical protein